MHDPARTPITAAHSHASTSTEIVFVDAAVEDREGLLAGLELGAAAYVLDPSRDGVAQIAARLAGLAGLRAISVIAHDTPGSVALGAGRLDAAGLAERAPELRAIGRAMAPGGVLNLFACEAGNGPDGRALVAGLSAASGVAVAAASRLIGGAEAGGNWSLDVRSANEQDALAGGSLPIAAQALREYAFALAGAGAPPAGFPLDDTSFPSSGSGFYMSGNASIQGGTLQLTPNALNMAGSAVYGQSFSSNLGLSVQFTYNSSGGNGADGISFFLLNGNTVDAAGGAANVTPGGYGGGLGYSDNGQAGITGGYLGVGFDTWGNYAQTDKGQTPSGIGSNNSATANYIGVRGQGSGTSGYNWITGAPYAPGIDGQRTVQINLIKVDASHEQLQVYMEPAGSNTFTKYIDTTISQTLPSSFYFGFAASTGGSKDLHAIDNVSVKLPVNLTFGSVTVQDQTTNQTNPASLNPGDQFSYTYTLTNQGPNGAAMSPSTTRSRPISRARAGPSRTAPALRRAPARRSR